MLLGLSEVQNKLIQCIQEICSSEMRKIAVEAPKKQSVIRNLKQIV